MIQLEIAKDIALKAGVIMKQYFGFETEKEFKSDHTPVTIADTTINSMVIQQLKKHFPDHGVLGEEESDYQENNEYIWVCDPIDGTVPFSIGMPTNVFSLALTHNGEVILGVIYDPYLDRMVWAEKGTGTFCNGKRIFVNQSENLQNQIIYSSYAHADITGLYAEIQKEHTGLLSFRSILYPTIFIAHGTLIGSFYPYRHAYDVATSKIIIEEAGGKVTDLFGNDQRYNRPVKGCIASNGKVHDQLVELAKKYITLSTS